MNKCRDPPREPPGSGIIGSFRSRALSASVGIAELLSREGLAICPPTGNLREFLFLHILGNVWCYRTQQCLWIGGCELVCHHVLICFSLMTFIDQLSGSLACELPIAMLCPSFYRVI